MNVRHAALILILAASTIGAAPAGQPQSFEDQRAAVLANVDGILGPGGIAAVSPFVRDGQGRIVDAIHIVAANTQSPMQVLTREQKRALRTARRTHQRPQLDLSADQRAAIAAYGRALAQAVVPIVRDDAGKIDAALTPQQRARLDDIYVHAQGELDSAAGLSPFADLERPLAAQLLRSPGAVVLLVHLDPRAIATAIF